MERFVGNVEDLVWASCASCQRKTRGPVCEAYPGGIPEVILNGSIDHKTFIGWPASSRSGRGIAARPGLTEAPFLGGSYPQRRETASHGSTIEVLTGVPAAERAHDLGIHHETLRVWVRQDEADEGTRADRLAIPEREELTTLCR